MQTRWAILAVLFLARLGMAFQFQSVAALSPALGEAYNVGLAEIGFLIGLYLAPGLLVAIPGGAVAARFGDKRVVTGALALMLAGALMAMVAETWTLLTAARILAGIGGVVVNIVMTKLLVDWFAGREIATAMAIFVNSWPVGIAVALLVLPPVAGGAGLGAAMGVVSAIVAGGLVLFALGYRPPDGVAAASGKIAFVGLPVIALTLAGLVWAFYNVALAMVFSFGPEALMSRGWADASANALVSAFMVVFSVFLPLGGIVADKTGARDAVILGSFLSFFCLFLLAFALPPLAVWVVALAVAACFGLAAGPIMTLPSAVLSAEARAFGMGVFFSIYYGAMMVAPALAGRIAEGAGNPAVAIGIGGVFLLGAILSLLLFRPLARD